ncbi:hypothetical protein [Rahnella victoriana]|uniref:Uncharacterized protein n=1 Tax=Rahnella victoriana TaxID=1510570 RepID=A0ABS0DW92_9GAMM|nr:hypothetical protein [Rahnella victoriana]MBF7958162.1 hypothetical protein [Rahnella victoriana]
MKIETEKELINYTSCLRSEYKDPARLSGCRESLVIYVKSCQDQINEYDRTHYPSGKAEPVEKHGKKIISMMLENVLSEQKNTSGKLKRRKIAFLPYLNCRQPNL